MTRHQTRYQPSLSFFSGTTIVSTLPAARRGGPAVCWCASASVTDTIVERGSTDSLYVRRRSFAGVFSVWLGDGSVRSTAACAHAAAGTASAAINAVSATAPVLLTRVSASP